MGKTNPFCHKIGYTKLAILKAACVMIFYETFTTQEGMP